MILGITMIIVCTFFLLVDLVPIYRNKQWWTFWVYSTMLALVGLLTILIALGIRIPSPADPLKKIVFAIWGI